MGAANQGIELQVIVIAMLIVVLLSVGVIMFFVIYHRRLLIQQKEKQQLESEYQTELLKASIESQESERFRISKEMHDNIGAMLTTTKMCFQHVSTSLSEAELDKVKKKMNSFFEGMIDSTRTISQNLSPIVLTKLGLIEAIRSLAESVEDTGNFTCNFSTNLTRRVGKSEELNIYRILQELITNTLKHSEASEIDIELMSIPEDNALTLVYKDNGSGFSPEILAKKKGIGLKNIESRLSVMKGNVVYSSSKDGFLVTMRMVCN